MLSKDNDYFVRDEIQCRSLTVRSVARLKNCSDSYFFQGALQSQFHQVGDAAPILVGNIVSIVWHCITQNKKLSFEASFFQSIKSRKRH